MKTKITHGDIVLISRKKPTIFSGLSIGRMLLEFFSGSQYTHIGCVVKYKNKKYFFHSTMHTKRGVPGVQIISLKKYLRNTSLSKYRKIRVSSEKREKKITKEFKKYFSKSKFNGFDYTAAFLSIFGIRPLFKERYNCGTFMGKLLEESGFTLSHKPGLPCEYLKIHLK